MRTMFLCDLVVIRRQLPQIALTSLICVLVFGVLTAASAAIVIMVSLMVTYMIIVTLAAYDDAGGWAAFRLTLPVSRRDVVLGRYATTMVACLASTALGIALSAIIGPIETAVLSSTTGGEVLITMGWNLSDTLMFALVGISLSLAYMAVVLPVYLTIGTTKGARLLVVLLFMAPLALLAMGNGIVSSIPESFTTGMVILVALPVVALALFAISATISMRLYARRDL